MPDVTGIGRTERVLAPEETEQVIAQGLAADPPDRLYDGKSVLVIVPDHTRTSPMEVVFPLVV